MNQVSCWFRDLFVLWFTCLQICLVSLFEITLKGAAVISFFFNPSSVFIMWLFPRATLSTQSIIYTPGVRSICVLSLALHASLWLLIWNMLHPDPSRHKCYVSERSTVFDCVWSSLLIYAASFFSCMISSTKCQDEEIFLYLLITTNDEVVLTPRISFHFVLHPGLGTRQS
jgi:hypothetical protein